MKSVSMQPQKNPGKMKGVSRNMILKDMELGKQETEKIQCELKS